MVTGCSLEMFLGSKSLRYVAIRTWALEIFIVLIFKATSNSYSGDLLLRCCLVLVRRMFVSSVKRLRIMRTSDANGLG